MIQDSGDRTLFSTGAVRDIQANKGRCDLMPLMVAGIFLHYDRNGDFILRCIDSFIRTNNTGCLYDALRHFSSKCFPDHHTALLEVSVHYEEGAIKYGENNWQKGIPVNCYLNSAIRHYIKYLRSDTDERHDRAFIWNIMCCIWEVDYREKNE